MQQYLRNTPARRLTYCKSVGVKLWLVALVVLGLMALTQTAFAALLITFDQSAYHHDVWIQVQDPNYLSTTGTNFQATYNNGTQSISFTNPNPPGGQAQMSVPVKLSAIGPGGLNVTMSVSTVIYVFYDDPSGNPQTAAPSPFTTLQRYQPFELTMTGNPADQGDLTAINCFTAPLSITSYGAQGTQLQHVGWTATATQIGEQLKQFAVFGGNASPVVKNASGKTIRYIGPSNFDPANPSHKPMPWSSFIPYTQSIPPTQQTHIFNQNSFNGGNGYTYAFGADMILTANSDGSGSLTITSKITATSTPTTDPNLPPSGYWDDSRVPGGNPWSISAADPDSFNYAIYAQTIAASAITFNLMEKPYTDFQNFCNSIPGLVTANAFDTTLNMIVGEATGAVLFGFANSSVPYNGTPIGNMNSQDWWTMNPVMAFSDAQPGNSNPPYYSAYGNVIYKNSNNGAYGAPYSDRFKTASNSPLVNSVQYNNTNVNSWVIGVGAPLGAPKTTLTGMLLLLLLDN